MRRLRPILTLSPLKISVGYFLFGVLWIPVTDILLALFFGQQMPTLLEVIKGWAFVGISAVLISYLSHLHQKQRSTVQTKLEMANQQLQVLQRVLRHNIRNDLNVISGYTEMVSQEISQEQSQYRLEVVQETAEQIINISEKLKIVEHIDPTLSDESVIDLVELVDSEVKQICSTYPEVTIDITAPERAWIEGDTSIRYAIRETLENAIIHHDQAVADCEISIRISRESDTVQLEIADNGAGIPQEELQAIQADEETPLEHMSSVGLWLVTWLCRLHGGAAEFQSANGTTITFFFQPEQFPLAESASPLSKLSTLTS